MIQQHGMMMIGNKLEGEKFLQDWKQACEESDGCSSWIAKYVAKFIFWSIRNLRNYKCICLQHDFDYRFGWKYGISKRQADQELKEGIKVSNHPFAARIMWWFVNKFGSRYYQVK
jgi:hypothetical protein